MWWLVASLTALALVGWGLWSNERSRPVSLIDARIRLGPESMASLRTILSRAKEEDGDRIAIKLEEGRAIFSIERETDERITREC